MGLWWYDMVIIMMMVTKRMKEEEPDYDGLSMFQPESAIVRGRRKPEEMGDQWEKINSGQTD